LAGPLGARQGPRGLIIAAPSSGAGKTTLTLGLIAALRRAGQQVRPFKVGPDYIDPTYLSAAADGQMCANLDPWAMRAETLARLVGTVRHDEIAIIEGVMGLHDGPGSTAALARATGWPILLVVDAAKSAQTAAAVVEGLALRDQDLAYAGIVFNRVASPRHEAMIHSGLTQDKPVWYLPPRDDLALPSRHLGLHLATELADMAAFLDQAATWATPVVAAAKLAKPATMAAPLRPLTLPESHDQNTQRLAHFGLCFHYPHLQPHAGSIFLPGGYPELALQAIKADPTFLPNLREAAAAGTPIYGECGGFMVLGEAIIDAQGTRHDMAGLLPVITTFAEPKRHLGYREIDLQADTAFGHAGQRWRGHEFHYTKVAWQGDAPPLLHCRDAYGKDLGPQGLRIGNVAGSYLHLIDQVASSH